ncbi:MAG: hypothetical protein ACHQ50_05925 [Fimbriimonadales bacterium]
MESLKIVGLCIASAMIYGILHDLVTANLCVEYFSVFHPPLFHTTSPWLLAFGWGVVATWWMGLFLGPLIAVSARSGQLPKLGWRDLVRPLVTLLLISYACALTAGLIGFFAVGRIPAWVYTTVPRMIYAHLGPDRQRFFTADLFAHNASYFVSGIGAFVVCGLTIRRRIRMNVDRIVGERPL